MLRVYFLPCDFYPKILMVGDKKDVYHLLDLLGAFLDDSVSIDIKNQPNILFKDFNLMLHFQKENELEGVFQADENQFNWIMSRDTALHFYQDIGELLQQPEQSGSLFLEVLRLDEIKIKISMNEFDDSYL